MSARLLRAFAALLLALGLSNPALAADPVARGLAAQARSAAASASSTAASASAAAAAAAASAATNATAINNIRTKIELVLGACQSNEHGNDPVADAIAYPEAFQALRNSVVAAPLSPAVSPTGGWLYKFYDDLWDYGYDVTIINGCIGSSSMLTDNAGFVKYRTAAAQYNGARASRGGIDRGYVGDVISPDGVSYWLCTTGNNRYAMNSGPRTIGDVGFGSAFADFASGFGAVTPGQSPALVNLSTAGTVYTASTTMGSATLVVTAINPTPGGTIHAYSSGVGGATGQPVTSSGLPSGTKIIGGPANGLPGTYTMNQLATATATGITVTETAPTFPTSPTGVQVQDGTIVWTLLQASTAPPYANAGTVLTETQAGIGFDPLGILQRNNEAGLAVRNVVARYELTQNGQADVGLGTTLYQAALTSVANFYLARRYTGVLLGFTNYSPGSTGTIAQWQQIETGRNNALTALQAANPGRVFAAADLFASMGSTGAQMGGAILPATPSPSSISGNTLTVGTVSQGTIEVGQNVWNGTVLVGTITGGSGSTWTLSNGVNTSGVKLIVAGTYLQYDGVHLNGAGYIAAGALEAAAFKAMLGKPGFGPISFGTDLPRAANDDTPARLAA